MYKNIELLDKKKHKSIKFDEVEANEVAKNIGTIPVGFNEVMDMACVAPVVIMENDFVAFTGINKNVTIFNDEKTYLPMFVRTYPFINVMAKNEKDELTPVVAVDNGDSVSKKGKNFIFKKDGELQDIADQKIKLLFELNRQRDISKKIIAEFKEQDLLVERDFKVKFKDEEKTILNKFYVINRAKVNEVDEKVLATWAKKGWISLIDCHIRSLGNFQKVLESVK